MRLWWIRIWVRRETIAALIFFALLIAARELLAVRGLALIDAPEGADLGPAESLAGYSVPASVGTVVLDSLPLLLAAAGFLTCWVIGTEFASGTVRTALVADPRRARYVISRLLVAAALSEVCLASVVLIAMVMPLLAVMVGVSIPPGVAAASDRTVLFVGLAAFGVLFPVASAGLVTTIVRSPLLAIAAFLGLAVVVGLASQLGIQEMKFLLPTSALLDSLSQTAPAGSLIPPPSSTVLFGEAPSLGAAVGVLSLWIVGLALAAMAVFRLRDINE